VKVPSGQRDRSARTSRSENEESKVPGFNLLKYRSENPSCYDEDVCSSKEVAFKDLPKELTPLEDPSEDSSEELTDSPIGLQSEYRKTSLVREKVGLFGKDEWAWESSRKLAVQSSTKKFSVDN
jgi:hypothetical protein